MIIYLEPEEEIGGNYIRWNKKFELGIPAIDEEHKRLVALCDELHSKIMKSGKGDGGGWEESLVHALHVCTEYVQTHFRHEEILMKACGYENFERHKKEHEAFTKKVLETAAEFNQASVISALQFVKFLYDWILSHIAHEDQLIARPVIEYYNRRKSDPEFSEARIIEEAGESDFLS